MNTALLAAIMRRKREVADRNAQNAERDARAAARDNLRRMKSPMYQNQLRIERHDAEVAQAVLRANQAAALIARTTIDPASIPEVPSIRAPPRPIAEYKNGGLVKKTGLAKVHKGEIVMPANRVEAVKKAVKKAGLKALKA